MSSNPVPVLKPSPVHTCSCFTKEFIQQIVLKHQLKELLGIELWRCQTWTFPLHLRTMKWHRPGKKTIKSTVVLIRKSGKSPWSPSQRRPRLRDWKKISPQKQLLNWNLKINQNLSDCRCHKEAGRKGGHSGRGRAGAKT